MTVGTDRGPGRSQEAPRPSLLRPQPGQALRHHCRPVCRASDCRASLSQVLSEPWRLSTSQIAQFQIRMFDPNKYPKHLGAGGGFGPVSALEGGQVGRTRGRAYHWGVQGLKGVRPEARAQAWTCLAWEQNGYLSTCGEESAWDLTPAGVTLPGADAPSEGGLQRVRLSH